MTVSANYAANAYANALKASDALGKGPEKNSAPEDLGGFADLVTGAVEQVAASGRKAEATATQVAEGKGNLVDLVTTIAETEVAMETLVTTRDRVISAYRDIMNMPI